VQKRRLYQEVRAIHAELAARQEVDVVTAQLLQAKAAVVKRSTEIVHAEMALRNAEAKIGTLVNDPLFRTPTSPELIPRNVPLANPVEVDAKQAKLTALKRRPEIVRAMREIRATGVRLSISEHELLPALNFVMETYAAGLRGESRIDQAFTDRFSRGEPSYSVGLRWDAPLGNRTAKARVHRRQLELRQMIGRLNAAVEDVLLEVEVAARDVQTYYRTMLSNHRLMIAERAEGKMQAAGRLTVARAELELRVTRLEKLAKLREKGHATENELQRAEADVAVARGNVLAAEEDQAIFRLECERIKAQIRRLNSRPAARADRVRAIRRVARRAVPGERNRGRHLAGLLVRADRSRGLAGAGAADPHALGPLLRRHQAVIDDSHADEPNATPDYELHVPRFTARVELPPRVAGRLKAGQRVTIRLPGSNETTGRHLLNLLHGWLREKLDVKKTPSPSGRGLG